MFFSAQKWKHNLLQFGILGIFRALRTSHWLRLSFSGYTNAAVRAEGLISYPFCLAVSKVSRWVFLSRFHVSLTLIQWGNILPITTTLTLFKICCFPLLIFLPLPYHMIYFFFPLPNTYLTFSTEVSFPTKFLLHTSEISVSPLKGPDAFLSGIMKAWALSFFPLNEIFTSVCQTFLSYRFIQSMFLFNCWE